MELFQLKTFQLVAAHRSFSRAAREIHLTQPAITQQIKNLENEVGEKLIERLGGLFTLTPAGEILLDYAGQILNLTEQALESVRQYAKERGRITIAAGTTNTIFRLPLILKDFHSSYPQVEIRIRNGDSELITKLVMENAVDLGLVTTVNPMETLKILPLFKDPIFLVAPKEYPNIISIPALEKESLILFRAGSGFRIFLEEQFNLNSFTPKIAMEMESIEAIIRLVRSGFGLAFLPEIAINEELKSRELQTVFITGWNEMFRQTYLIYRREKYLTWPIKAFLEQVNIPV